MACRLAGTATTAAKPRPTASKRSGQRLVTDPIEAFLAGAGLVLEASLPNVAIGSTVTATNNVSGNNNNGIYILGPNATGVTIVNTSVEEAAEALVSLMSGV